MTKDTAPSPKPTVSNNKETSPKIASETTSVPTRLYEEPLRQDIIESPVMTKPSSPEPVPALVPVKIITKKPKKLEHVADSKTKPGQDPEKESAPEEKAHPEPKQLAAATPLPVPKPDGKRPKIVIVIDDLGIDKPRTARTIKLRAPLTLSFLSYANGLNKQTLAAREKDHELWLHIPMEPGSPDVDPGPNVLLTGIPEQELLNSLKWNLEQFNGYVGINNHMGSRFTADLEGLTVVMKELKKRGLLFLDSVTSGKSVAGKAARATGVPFISRNVFLDHQDDTKGIEYRLKEVERLALKTGLAIAIGHPKEKTLKSLGPWLDSLDAKGFQLVPLSTVMKRP